MCPLCCNIFTMAYLCSGKTWAKPSACVDLFRSIQGDLPFRYVAGEKLGCRLDVCAHVQFRCNLTGDRDIVAGNHFYFHPISASTCDSALRIGKRWIQQRQNSEENPLVTAFGDSDTDGAITAAGETVLRLFPFLQIGTGKFGQRQNYLWRALANAKDLPGYFLNCCFRAFAHRIEWDIRFLLITFVFRFGL